MDTNKLKIAIILTGHLRSYTKTYSSFISAFLEYNPDIFLHTWNKWGHDDKTWWSNTGDPDKSNVSDEDISKVISIYKPVYYTVEEQIRQYTDNVKIANGWNRLRYVWYSPYTIYKAIERYQIDNNISYDVIIKTRFDIGYENKLPKDELYNISNNQSIMYIQPNPSSLGAKRYSEVVIITSPVIMNKITNFYNKMEPYLESCVDRVGNVQGEESFKDYMLGNNLLDATLKYTELKSYILRTSGTRYNLYK